MHVDEIGYCDRVKRQQQRVSITEAITNEPLQTNLATHYKKRVVITTIDFQLHPSLCHSGVLLYSEGVEEQS